MQKWNMLYIKVKSVQGKRSTYGIVQRTESDWVANGIRLDGGRNLTGRRTETSGDVPPTDAPTKQTERVSHRIRGTHRTFWQRKPPTDRHRLGGYGIPAIPTPPITQPNIPWIPWIPWENTTTLINKQTGRVFPQNTQNTQNILAEKCLPQIDTDAHRLGATNAT